MTDKTCDKCSNYVHGEDFKGECNLIDSGNNYPMMENGIMSWDYEGYSSGCYVGPKFGCIHWEKKDV